MTKFYTIALYCLLLCTIACQSGKSPKQATQVHHAVDNDSTSNHSESASTTTALPDHLEEAKKKCTYQNLKKIDLGDLIPCDFKNLKPVSEQAFKQLNLQEYLKKAMPDDINFKKDRFYYYSFQQNIEGNVMVTFMWCTDGIGNELIGLLYNPKGALLGHTTLAYNGGDMDMVWNFKGEFDSNSYKYEYKKYLGTQDKVCEWYTSSLNFAKNGKITNADTVFKVKADPTVPCYEKFKNKD